MVVLEGGLLFLMSEVPLKSLDPGRFQKLEIVTYLLSAGAGKLNPKPKPCEGIQCFLKPEQGFNPAHNLILTAKPVTPDRFQKLEIVTYLLSAGAVKEARDKKGQTALHVSVSPQPPRFRFPHARQFILILINLVFWKE